MNRSIPGLVEQTFVITKPGDTLETLFPYIFETGSAFACSKRDWLNEAIKTNQHQPNASMMVPGLPVYIGPSVKGRELHPAAATDFAKVAGRTLAFPSVTDVISAYGNFAFGALDGTSHSLEHSRKYVEEIKDSFLKTKAGTTSKAAHYKLRSEKLVKMGRMIETDIAKKLTNGKGLG